MTHTIFYRVGRSQTYETLIKNSFDLSKLGTNYGQTLGLGIYLTKSPEETAGYATDKQTIIEVPVEGVKTYKLDRTYSLDCAKQKRKLRKIIEQAKVEGYNSIESVDRLETVIWSEPYTEILLDYGNDYWDFYNKKSK